ncbi:MAG: hypothetical protein ACW99U_12805 [Candidatus Thorarchaeota archaeon]
MAEDGFKDRKSTEFRFRGKWWDLDNILDEDQVYDMGDEDRPIKIVVRAGIGRLKDHFGEIDASFGPVQSVQVCDSMVATIECCCQDTWVPSEEEIADGWEPSSRPGRSFGEASGLNCKGVAAKYPISMAEKRGVARALFDLLGIRGAYTEDEAEEFKEEVRKQRKEKKSSKPTAKEEQTNIKEVVAEINHLIEDLKLSEDDKLDEYRNVMGDKELTKKQIAQRATSEVKIKVRDRLRERVKSK